MNTVYINSVPKSGTHLLHKTVALMHFDAFMFHFPHREIELDCPMVMVKRDPRNVLISLCRHIDQSVSPQNIIDRMYSHNAFDLYDYTQAINMVDFWAKWEGWLSDPQCLVVSFEDLANNNINAVASHLNYSGDIDVLCTKIYGDTQTHTGQHSDWTRYWDEIIDKEFEDIGGYDLMTRWGYEP